MRKIIISLIILSLVSSSTFVTISGETIEESEIYDIEKLINETIAEMERTYEPIELDDYLNFSPYLSDQNPKFKPGEIIIKFKENQDIKISNLQNNIITTGIKSIDALNNKYSVISAEKLFTDKEKSSQLANIYKLSLKNDNDVIRAVYEYKKDSSVEFTELNYIYTLFYAQEKFSNFPNDPYLHYQWALHNIGQTGGTPDADIDAPEGWYLETGSSDVIIAIIDTGVDYNHPDLTNNMWIDANGKHGYDFVNDDDDPMDDYGHGTHCAGIASAVTDNNIGIAGVSWNCKIMALKCFDSDGNTSVDILSDSIVYAADNGANIISMSWGGPYPSNLLKSSLDYAFSKDISLIAAAGNGFLSSKKMYPAAYENVIAVAATDNNDTRAIFTSQGFWVDVSAPGVDILSLRAEGTNMCGCGNNIVDEIFYIASGTSMACPHVAGLAGLLYSKNQCEYQAYMAKTLILNSVDKINSSWKIGRGRINAYNALKRDPAIAVLELFENLYDIKGLIDIKGGAWGEKFNYYILEYGRGKEPINWVEFINSQVPISKGVLATLDTTTMEEGLYTIKLRVVCQDYIYEDKITIVVNNIYNIVEVDDDNIQGPWNGTTQYPYQYIQDGIDDAGIGDMVFVHNGTYYEYVIVDRKIDLTGENKNNTILNGNIYGTSKEENIILIIADQVNLSGFTVKNAKYFVNFGINVKADNINISDMVIKDNECNGLAIYYATEINVTNCIITNSSSIGVFFHHSSVSGILNSYISNNAREGILLNNAQNITIKDNNFYNDGINILGNLIKHWNSHIIDNNFINDKEIVYYTDIKDGTRDIYIQMVISGDFGQVILANCTQISIQDSFMVEKTDVSIQLGFCDGILIKENIITNALRAAIYLDKSDNTHIKMNDISEVNFGVHMFHSSNNFMSENNILESKYGIFILGASINNIISKNNLEYITDRGIILWAAQNIVNENSIKNCYIGAQLATDQIIFKNNNFINNGIGLYLLNAQYNQITNNYFTENYECGIFIYQLSIRYKQPKYNIISSNIFHNNYLGIYAESISVFSPITENIIQNNLFTNNENGIFLIGCVENKIKNNNIHNNNIGINLSVCKFNNISENNIENNNKGIYSNMCSKNTIYKNIIKQNNEGITLIVTGNNSISYNEILENVYGIYFYLSGVNVIFINNFTSNNYGATIEQFCFENTFYHNNFKMNSEYNAYDTSFTTNWYNDYLHQGNYWDDYEGWDLFPRDGIGDIPYNVPPRTWLNKDRYPLMNPYNGSVSSSDLQTNEQSTATSESIEQLTIETGETTEISTKETETVSTTSK